MLAYSRMNVQPIANQVITHYVHGFTRNLVCGAGLAYTVHNENYSHIPLIILFPSIYAGYNLYDNKDKVIHYLKTEFKR
jgi:hypothetical protein